MANINVQIPEDLKHQIERTKKMTGLSITSLTIIALRAITEKYLNEKNNHKNS